MTRNVCAVTSYFDDERTQPADYVVELREGLFEARVWDEAEIELGYERVIGIFVNENAACRALHHHEHAWFDSIATFDVAAELGLTDEELMALWNKWPPREPPEVP